MLLHQIQLFYDVRQQASQNPLPKLQKKLLKDFGEQVEHLSFTNIHEGMDNIASCLRSVSMLVVLDDVDNKEQIDALVPPEHSLGWGSLIIITTRDLKVLKSAGISSSSIYEMKRLDDSYARELFCWHAFESCDPAQGFEDLVEKFLSTCERLPLSLKVFGSQLRRESKEYWESQINEFSRVLPEDIKSKLKISYDALGPDERELFLDIACFFIGERKSLVIEAWDGMGQSGVYRLQTLKDKCLVELDQKNRIKMHDHLRDLGREIAREKSPIRIWRQGQINSSLLQAKEEMQIRGIMAATTFFEDVSLSSLSHDDGPFALGYCSTHYGPFEECAAIMESSRRRCWDNGPSSLPLKLLVLNNKYFSTTDRQTYNMYIDIEKIGELSKGLVWLRWFDFCHKCLPSCLSLGNLRVLELYEVQHIETLWENNSNPPLELRELIIQENNGCFKSFPKSIGSLKYLKKLVIHSEGNSSLSSLPKEFCELKSLEHLELDCFENLSSLPRGFGDLTNLRHVTLTSLSS